MTAILLPNGKQQYFTTAGLPAVGYKVATFDAGTSNPRITWQDALKVAQNTNPVILDGRGEASIFWEGVYKVQLQDSTGAVIWTQDNVGGQQNSLTASLLPAVTNSIDLGSATFSWRNLYLGPNNAPVLDTVSGNIGYYARTAVEIAAGVTPTNFSYLPLDPRRYATTAQWAAVYAAVSTLATSYDIWSRGDHAQHPALTNCSIGFESYDDSQKSGTIGYRCTAVGALALQQNKNSVSAGGTNTAVGWAAMQQCVECSGNTAVGAVALNSITGVNSSHNNAFGYRVLTLLVNGTQNNCFGFQTANSLVTGDNNHAFGENTLAALTTGRGNHAFGYQALFTKAVGDFTHALGYQALFNETQSTITGITVAASAVVTINTVSAANPFAVGGFVGFEGVNGMTQINGLFGSITAIGGASGAWTVTLGLNSSGFSAYTSGGFLSPIGNTVFGYRTAQGVTFGSANVVIGHQAGEVNSVGDGCVLVGHQAGQQKNVGFGDVAIGYQALLRSVTGGQNVAIGSQAGNSIGVGPVTSTDHVVIGSNAGQGIVGALRNVCIGSVSGVNLNGNNNTSVGYNAGSQGAVQTFANTSSFGANAVPTGSNQVTFGDSGVTTIRAQVTVITALSDARFKKNIEILDLSEGFLDEVQIVAFEWIAEDMQHHGRQVGVIAQQLDALQEKYGLQWLGLVDKSNPDQWAATPGKLLFPLIQRVQKQQAQMRSFEARLAALEAR